MMAWKFSMLVFCRMSWVVLRKVVNLLAESEFRSRFRQRVLSAKGLATPVVLVEPYWGRPTGPVVPGGARMSPAWGMASPSLPREVSDPSKTGDWLGALTSNPHSQ